MAAAQPALKIAAYECATPLQQRERQRERRKASRLRAKLVPEATARGPVSVEVTPTRLDINSRASVTVTVFREWREAHPDLPPQRVFEIVRLNTICCNPETMQEARCNRCKDAVSSGGKVFRLMAVDHVVRFDLETGMEKYLFQLKTLCTSSRSHLKLLGVALAISLEGLLTVSNTVKLVFLLRDKLAREQKRCEVKYCDPDMTVDNKVKRKCSDGAATAKSAPATPSSELEIYKNNGRSATPPRLARPYVMDNCLLPVPTVVFIYRQSVSYHPRLAITAVNKKPNLLAGRLCPRVDKLMLALTTRGAMSQLQATAPKGWAAIATGDGPNEDNNDSAHWYSVGIELFSSVGYAERYLRGCEDFMRCRNGFKNVYNVDLIAADMSVPVAVFTSWNS
eukprot:TRINITY_DN4535_c0_g1_i1.p1 TRINITY_DN4535_c0_g1~~TRINITY_DN4535_c0_g1_i1.p1  ORF type:complete len:411 (+),score=72.86 TRINITY_DN4535_c0_g1_i1:50-1234(+)